MTSREKVFVNSVCFTGLPELSGLQRKQTGKIYIPLRAFPMRSYNMLQYALMLVQKKYKNSNADVLN